MRKILFKAIEYLGLLGAIAISIGLANLRPNMVDTLWTLVGINLALLVCWIGAEGYRKAIEDNLRKDML